MKIYMVIGDNLESAYEDYKEWNEAAFASKKVSRRLYSKTDR